MNRLKEKYNKEIVPALKEKFGYSNKNAVPQLVKATINIGISASKKDDKYQELVSNTLQRISGQKPVFTTARQAISAFKIREGNVVGIKVTLRGNKLYDFIDKLINITLPRVRDFRGIKKSSVDRQGNLNLGFKEHVAFAEIDFSEVESLHGLEVNITSTAPDRAQGLALFKLLGFPFVKEKTK